MPPPLRGKGLWADRFHRAKKCCSFHLGRQAKCILMCSPSPGSPSGPGHLAGGSPFNRWYYRLARARNRPSLPQVLNAHFQVIEILREVRLTRKYRLAPLPRRQSCLVGSLRYSRFMKCLAQAGRAEREWTGVRVGRGYNSWATNEPECSQHWMIPKGMTHWVSCLYKMSTPLRSLPSLQTPRKLPSSPTQPLIGVHVQPASSFPHRSKT